MSFMQGMLGVISPSHLLKSSDLFPSIFKSNFAKNALKKILHQEMVTNKLEWTILITTLFNP